MMICVFGASSNELDPLYIKLTEELGEALAKRGHSLIFGGGANGLMGAAARGFTKGGGRIVGVAPRFFDKPGILYPACDEFVYPDTMRERKAYMEDHADAFIVTPGGVGTYEEFFEVLTLKKLARHGKPIVLYNMGGFFDKLTALIHADVEGGLIPASTEGYFQSERELSAVIRAAEAPPTDVETIRFTE